MIKKLFLCFLAALLCAMPVAALEVESGSVHCFSGSDFADDSLVGVCIRSLPDNGAVMLGTRLIQPGDILTTQQLAQMTFAPVDSQTDATATLEYLPIFADRVEDAAELTFSIRGKKDKAPTARDSQLETYRNIPNEGRLKASDPEDKPLTYTITRQPRRGTVEISQDGTFRYTPKKNKVGVDSFTFTATDPAGNVSEEATVTIKILKPSDGALYSDTAGLDCRFEAEWLRSTGIFAGEQVGGRACFRPEKPVTKGEFTAMLVEALEIPRTQEAGLTDMAQNAPDWLKPYLAAALRSGLLTGLAETAAFDAPITGRDAAIMLQNALDLSVTQQTLEAAATSDAQAVPVWAEASLTAMAQGGIVLEANAPLTRGAAACALYQADYLALYAPGTTVFPTQD